MKSANNFLQKLALCSILFMFSVSAFSQANLDIKSLQKEALGYFEVDEFNNALPLYKKIDSLKPNDPETLYKLGICYFYAPNSRKKSLPYFEKVRATNLVYKDLDYYLGCIYQLEHKFDLAILSFESFKKIAEKKGNRVLISVAEIDKHIKECNTGKILMASPLQVKIDNMGASINSVYNEYAPVISADETELIFTSRRPNTTGGGKDDLDGDFFEDIYISFKEGDAWTKPELISEINTPTHDACIGLSPDGQKLLIYKDSKGTTNKRVGFIYSSDLKGNKWTAPVKLGETVNAESYQNSASISGDEQTLYFTSDRPGGFGGIDIYKSSRLPNGEWGVAKNLGPMVNTKEDDDAPFIAADNKTLNFSSKGHDGMGGFDIFTSVLNESDSTWSKPVNIGFPLNTADDDIFFVWSADGTRGYFASSRADSYGGKDLYVVTRPEVTQYLVILKGKITSAATGKPIAANITVVDNKTNQTKGVFSSNSFSGRYTVILPTGGNYGVSVDAEGYLFHSENIDVPIVEQFLEVSKDIALEQLVPNSLTNLKNVFFESGKDVINALSYPELDRLYKVLKNNPELYLEVAGHTDSVGDAGDNLKLSQLRADAIKNYLVNKGIDPKRFFTVGYGEEFPIATNATEEGRKMNRRTEIVIIENPKDRKLLAKEDGYYYKLQRKRQLEEEIERQRLENERLARKRAEEQRVCLGLEELAKNPFRVTFESGKYALSDSVISRINSIIAVLRCPNKYVLTIAGHADSVGKAENNLKLSKFRATATRDYLISQGIDKNKLKIAALGESQPFTSNSTPEGRRLNRRVEFIINLKK